VNPAAQARIDAYLADPAIAAVLAALNGDGEDTRIVGGAVRNLMLDEPPGDCDLATTCLPPETIARGEGAGFKAVPTGIAHGTVTLVRDGRAFEVTTLRRDVETDGRHAAVAFGRDFVEDALRRDFTVNALGLSIDGVVHDHAGGLADLAARRIRFIGDPDERIREDYLRILRFFRFHAQYGAGEPDRAGLAACIAGRSGLGALSRERVRAELMKLLVAPGAVAAVTAMADSGLLLPILSGVPRLTRFAAVARSDTGEVYPAFRLAALVVVVGEDAVRLREGLKLSNDEFDRIARLARAQEALAGSSALPAIATLRHLADETGTDSVAGALVLLDACAPAERQARMQALIAELGRTPRFLPSGRDVVALGIPAGPAVGKVLEIARRGWIEAGAPAGAGEQMELLRRAAAASNG
jgi:poly(A) polymerase